MHIHFHPVTFLNKLLQWWTVPSHWFLLLILIGAAVVRLSALGTVPATLNRDEAALAYNALLLQQTGTDEWQRWWPLTLESFGDYKLPGYVWWLVPLFTFLGTGDWVVRLPSAVAGVVIVAMTYGLARKWGWSEWAGLVAAMMAAVTPGLVFYSRMAWEANLGLALLLIGTWLVWPGAADKNKKISSLRLTVAGLVWLVAIFTYNTPWLLLPFITLMVAWSWGWKVWSRWLAVVVVLLAVWWIGAKVFIPLTQQKSGITIFSDETIWMKSVEYRLSLAPALQPVFGSKYVYWFAVMTDNWLKSWSPQFLVFTGGAHPWHQVPGFAHLSLPVYCLMWLGLISLVGGAVLSLRYHTKTIQPRSKYWLVLWLGLSLLPAIITVDAPHATRSLLFLPLACIAAAEGAVQVARWLQKISDKYWIIPGWWLVVGVLLISAAAQYLTTYFTSYPTQSAHILRAGFGQKLMELEKEHPGEPVAVVDSEGYQYISAAWYLKVPPAEYFATTVRQLPNRIGMKYGQQLGRYHFIAHPGDRVASEPWLLEWNEVAGEWQVTHFAN